MSSLFETVAVPDANVVRRAEVQGTYFGGEGVVNYVLSPRGERRAQARGAVVKAQEAPTAGPRTPDVRIAPAQPEETEPQGPRMWGDLPGDERRAAGGGGRP